MIQQRKTVYNEIDTLFDKEINLLHGDGVEIMPLIWLSRYLDYSLIFSVVYFRTYCILIQLEGSQPYQLFHVSLLLYNCMCVKFVTKEYNR